MGSLGKAIIQGVKMGDRYFLYQNRSYVSPAGDRTLADIEPSLGAQDLKEGLWLFSLAGREPRYLAPYASDWAWSGDGRYLALQTLTGHAALPHWQILDADGNELLTGEGWLGPDSLQPEGVVYLQAQTLYWQDYANGSPQTLGKLPGIDPERPVFALSHGVERVAYACHGTRLCLADLKTGEIRPVMGVVVQPSYFGTSLSWHPQADVLALLIMANILPQPQALRSGDPEKKLTQAEEYANRALELIESIALQPGETEEQLNNRKAQLAKEPHSALGMVHLSRAQQGLEGMDLGELVLLPRAMFDAQGEVTLDDLSLKEMESDLGVPVAMVGSITDMVRCLGNWTADLPKGRCDATIGASA